MIRIDTPSTRRGVGTCCEFGFQTGGKGAVVADHRHRLSGKLSIGMAAYEILADGLPPDPRT